MLLKLLSIGDVVGPAAMAALTKKLWSIRSQLSADVCVVNAENAAEGNGLEGHAANLLLQGGADVITSGNHIWRKREIRDYLRTHDRVLRPANYPAGAPGSGYTIIDVSGYKLLVINALGTMYLEALDDPFRTIDGILERESGRYDLAALDFHAEATSEKMAIGRYFDGRIAMIWGTHTHCPTADARIFPGGSGYITDIGFTGPDESILGVKIPIILKKMTTKLPERFDVADGPISMSGALFTYDTETRRCTGVQGITGWRIGE